METDAQNLSELRVTEGITWLWLQAGTEILLFKIRTPFQLWPKTKKREYSLCLLSGLCESWRMAGLKGEGGRTGDWEGFSSLTATRLDLCSYRQTRHNDMQRVFYQESQRLLASQQMSFLFNILFCWHTQTHSTEVGGWLTCFLVCEGDCCPIGWNWGIWGECIIRGEGLSRRQPRNTGEEILLFLQSSIQHRISLKCAVMFTIFNVWWFPSLKLHFLHKNDLNVRLQVSQ